MKRHSFRAEWRDGHGIVVRGTGGREVPVEFGGTMDDRTAYAFVRGFGFIGGWQNCRGKRWRQLISAINRGELYESMSELPTGRDRR